MSVRLSLFSSRDVDNFCLMTVYPDSTDVSWFYPIVTVYPLSKYNYAEIGKQNRESVSGTEVEVTVLCVNTGLYNCEH